MARSDIIDIACTIHHETDAAYLVDAGTDEKVWLPKSQCEWCEEDNTMALPEWLAHEKGLI